MTAASIHNLKRVISSSAPLAKSNDHSCRSQSATIDTVSTTCDRRLSPAANHDSSVNSRTSDGLERNPNTRQLIVDDRRTYHGGCLPHSTLSSESRGERLRLLESMDEVDEMCGVGTSVAAKRGGTTSADSEASYYRSSENLSVGREAERSGSLTHEQHVRDSLAGSFTLPDPDALSTLSSNASHGRRLRVTRSEAFTSQERLQLPRGSESFETCAPSIEGSRQCSREVRIAFPGIHHALMEQWVQESSESTQPHNIEGDVAVDSIPVAVPTASTQTTSETPLTFSDNVSCGAAQTNAVTAERPPETRHSFGLHISLRDVSRLQCIWAWYELTSAIRQLIGPNQMSDDLIRFHVSLRYITATLSQPLVHRVPLGLYTTSRTSPPTTRETVPSHRRKSRHPHPCQTASFHHLIHPSMRKYSSRVSLETSITWPTAKLAATTRTVVICQSRQHGG